MAEKRMISRRVSKSKKLAAVTYQTEAIYYRALPFLDDAGRMTADPEEFRAEALSMGKRGRPVPLSQVEAAIGEMHDIGLIGICKCDKTTCMEYTDFLKFQVLKKDRDPQITCKEPNVFQWIPMSSNGIPNRREEKLREGKEDAREAAAPEVENLIHKIQGIKGWNFTEEEDANFFTRLLADYSLSLISKVLEDLRTYQEKPAKHYTNLHLALRNWCKREMERNPSEQPKEPIPTDDNGKKMKRVDGEFIPKAEWEEIYREGKLVAVAGGWKSKEAP